MHPAVLRLATGALLGACCMAAQAATTVVLPATSDNSLFSESGSLSDGAGPHLWVGQTNGGVNRRALLRFDLSQVPAGHVVVGARLRLFMSMTKFGIGRPVDMYRVTASWGEGTSSAGIGGTGFKASAEDATWQFRFFGSGTPWGTPGGDFVAGPASASSVVGVSNSTQVWSGPGMVADVNLWLSAPSQNLGWILIGDETTSSAARYNSRTSPGAPVLELDLIPASANVPIPMAWLLVGGCALLGVILKRRG
ncbi:MAG: DNRLRE domain-containing protein [bacterium]|jgi:hypothetical protein|nr:DNRLRE domain-containing protein [Betaproteobacteria bacterium]